MSTNTPTLEERLVGLCNRLADGLDIDVGELGADRFVDVLTEALEASGLRIALYDTPTDIGASD